MIKKLLFFCCCSLSTFAQTSLPNLDFENWILSASTQYEDPTPTSIWATPNYSMDLILGNPSTSLVQKSTDMHGGSYAALMKSRSIAGNFAGATLFTGYLNTASPLNPVAFLGVPFTGRPVAMKGWYKYTSVNGDSSNIYIKLTKWNTTTNSRDVIGFVEKRDYTSVNAYTAFNMPINYFSSLQPDSITIVFTASAGAEQSLGEVGSSLWIDDVTLDYGANSVKEDIVVSESYVYPNPCTDIIKIKNPQEGFVYTIINISGQQVALTSESTILVPHLPLGFYILKAHDSKNILQFQSIINKK